MLLKQSLIYKRENLGERSKELTNLKFSIILSVSQNMLHESQQLANKCWQLNIAKKIYSTWFIKNVLNIRLTKHERTHKYSTLLTLRTTWKRTSWRSTLIISLCNLINQSNNITYNKYDYLPNINVIVYKIFLQI